MGINAKRSFGKELEAVLGVTNSVNTENDSSQNIQRELKTVMISQLVPGKYQPRVEFDLESLKELSESIKENGILQPIIVRSVGQNYEIIAGERRWRASKIAGLEKVPVIICNIGDESALAFALIENIQRKDLNPIEEANALHRLVNEFAMTHEQIAKVVGRSRTMVTNMLRLLNLPELLKEMLVQRKIEMGHARAVLTLPGEEQVQVVDSIIANGLNVRETEELVRRISKKSGHKNFNNTQKQDPKIVAFEKELLNLFNIKAEIKTNKKGNGKLVLSFQSFQKLEYFISTLRRNRLSMI
ncbi:MAG: ParB/RepB/Spo0J family partition protein [Proteobacteria bacterium]|nr:ParB/RepB/Spo0J family partition protein [Pseudomonadota bacterium]